MPRPWRWHLPKRRFCMRARTTKLALVVALSALATTMLAQLGASSPVIPAALAQPAAAAVPATTSRFAQAAPPATRAAGASISASPPERTYTRSQITQSIADARKIVTPNGVEDLIAI